MKLLSNDYRICCIQNSFCNILDKKDFLKKEIKSDHPKVRNFYNHIKIRQNKYFKSFIDIYNRRCAYCGVTTDIQPLQLFEIDHFICKNPSENYKEDKQSINDIYNLVLCCRYCNKSKSNFYIMERERLLLNPDNSNITKVFYRSEDFYIKIQDEFSANKNILEFYNKLNLGGEFKRLDYILMILEFLILYTKNNIMLSHQLCQVKDRLLKLRNNLII